MIKKNFLNTYKQINQLNPQTNSPDTSSEDTSTSKTNIYRSKEDERLIKEFHFAKFQKNLDNTKKNNKLKELLEKEEWNEEDVKALLASLN